MIVGGQTSARALTIIDYHQLSLTIIRRLTRALRIVISRNISAVLSVRFVCDFAATLVSVVLEINLGNVA